MKISENWLRALADPGCDQATLVQRLTMAGLEVEGIEALGDGLDGVLVGEIIAAEKHPNADKLRVCQVAVGAASSLQIVCGAPNARVGLKAPLAPIGARLPNGLTIKKARLREVDSFGMLCSSRELGLGVDSDGLLELPADAPTGQPLAAYLGLPDASIEIKLTPNRPDCLGLAGLAAELRALFDLPAADDAIAAVAVSSSSQRSVRLADPADCPRYLGRVIEGVDANAETPLWIKERLRRSGLRPINVAVDCSNYVLIELGQPTHAFDLARLDGGIEVRRARAGETLKLLDERELALDPEFLVIADASKALAVAGVMGGWDSRVTDATESLFLESAFFAPAAIQGRARKLGLHTDASHRFERGVDPELPRRAIERLSALIIAIAGGRAGPITEAVVPAALPRPRPVVLRRQRLARVLGIAIADQRVTQILQSLGMSVEATAEGWSVTAPSKRFDIAIEEDLIEEVARIFGYDAIPEHAPRGEIELACASETRVGQGEFRASLLADGCMEALNFSFVAADTLDCWGLSAGAVALANPLSAELGVMRTSLLPGLVEAQKRNQARQQGRVRLFEIGRVFAAGDPPQETERLAAVLSGSARAEQWGEPRRALDFFDVKGTVERLLALSGDPTAFRFDAAGLPPWLHPGRSARVWRGETPVGLLGCLDPRLAQTLELAGDTWVFELDLAAIALRRLPRAGELSRFPSLRRDLALLVEQSVSFARIQAVAAAELGDLLRECLLFDEFIGPSLPSGTRSLAIGLILQDSSRTLTDPEVERAMAGVIDALARETGARLRG
ncbi:MAG: phenylalanine--tRNA ligase subunit beta [Lysobacterales bacterium]